MIGRTVQNGYIRYAVLQGVHILYAAGNNPVIQRHMGSDAGEHKEVDLGQFFPITVVSPTDKVNQFAVGGYTGDVHCIDIFLAVYINPPAEKVLLQRRRDPYKEFTHPLACKQRTAW